MILNEKTQAEQATGMGRVLKYLLYLTIIAVIGLIGYSYFGDMSPDQEEVRFQIEAPTG